MSRKAASALADKQVSDAANGKAKAKAAKESRALKVGNQVLIVSPWIVREMHMHRIGKIVSFTILGTTSSSSWYSIEFADGTQISFRAKELELCPSPTALSYI